MASQPRNREREEERHLSIRTLAIASAASATAAILTSYFWRAGTPIAAAVTPVMVALISELLHRPTAAVARKMTSERTAILPAPDEPPAEPGTQTPAEPKAPPVRVYKQRPPQRRRKIAVGVVVTTAALAFAIAAAALTLPELVTGDSIGRGGRDTTLFGGRDRDRQRDEQEAPSQTAPAETVTETAPARTETVPGGGTPSEPRERTETETAPTETETTPKNQQR